MLDKTSKALLEEGLQRLKAGETAHLSQVESIIHFDFSDLGRLLRNPLTRTPQVRVALRGRKVQESRYTRTTVVGRQEVNDSICPERIAKLISQGATVTLDSLELSVPEVAEVCQLFEDQLQRPCLATAYITPANVEGLAPHIDEEDVMMVQTAGSKHWRYGQPEPGVGTMSRILEGDYPNLTQSGLLQTGGLITLPSGTPHSGTSSSKGSIHITFSVERPRYGKLFSQLLSKTVESSAFPSKLHEQLPFDNYQPSLNEYIEPIISALEHQLQESSKETCETSAQWNERIEDIYASWDAVTFGAVTVKLKESFTLNSVDENTTRIRTMTSGLQATVSRELETTLRTLLDRKRLDHVDVDKFPILSTLAGYGVVSANPTSEKHIP